MASLEQVHEEVLLPIAASSLPSLSLPVVDSSLSLSLGNAPPHSRKARMQSISEEETAERKEYLHKPEQLRRRQSAPIDSSLFPQSNDSDGGLESVPTIARESLLTEKLILSGYLNKKGERRKNWKKRWFVLRPSKLAYYKDDREYKLIRLIKMTDIHSAVTVEMKRHPYAFGVVTQDRTYYLEAPSAKAMEEWIAAIDKILDKIGDEDDIAANQADSEGPQHSMAISPRPKKMSLPPQRAQSLSLPRNHSTTPTSTFPRTPLSIQPSPNEVSIMTPSPIDIPQRGRKLIAGSPPSRDYFSSTDVGSSTSSAAHQSPPSPVSSPNISSAEGGFPIKGHRVSTEFVLSASPPPMAGTLTNMVPESGSNALGLTEVNPTSSEDECDLIDFQPDFSTPLDTDKAVQEGYLWKMGRNKQWRRRWFVLRENSLAYYKSPTLLQTKPNRIMPLSTVVDAIEADVKSRPHAIKIITPKRVYICAADSETEEVRWLSALQIVLVRNRAAQDTTAHQDHQRA